jgi:glutamate-1-semialdehyde 2,1-aminomutase
MQVFRAEPVVEHLHLQGERLRAGVRAVAEKHGVADYVQVFGRACNLLFGTRGPDLRPSQAFRALFMQEVIRRGVIAPSFVVSYSHGDDDIDRTIEAVDGALGVYARALSDGVDKYLVGSSSRPVFERR